MRDILTTYRNGNYKVVLLKDGTKIRYNNEDNLHASFAESIDCTITTVCDGGCRYCYLNCNPNGKHADLNQPFFDTLNRGQELALNGNDLSHPHLVEFLQRMKRQGVICNLTVNQKHFMQHVDFLRMLAKDELIYGLGISLIDSSDRSLYEYIEAFPNAVIHTIDGLLTEQDIKNMSDRNIKLLILGYKILGRGDKYYWAHQKDIENNVRWLGENIMTIKDQFAVVSFDNLAIEHLDLKSKVDLRVWDYSYMGDEGSSTFYIDAVNKKFAVSSTDSRQFDLMNSVDDMFQILPILTEDE